MLPLSPKNIFKCSIFLLSLLVLSSCVMVARKGAGQLRPTEAKISRCPINLAVNANVYAVSIITQSTSGKHIVSVKEKNYFFNELSKALSKHNIKIDSAAKVHFFIQFKKLDSSFIKNQRELTGTFSLVDSAQRTKFSSAFTVTTHKSLSANKSLLESLASKIATCFPYRNTH